jgi:hypothetical protein
MQNNDIIKKYNKHCNIYFKYELINNYNINFYSDDNKQKFIILRSDKNTTLWCEYKIICSIDSVLQYILWSNDMISIEKSIKANNNIKNDFKNKNLEEFLLEQTIKYNYIGLIATIKNNVKYYFFITEIIKL